MGRRKCIFRYICNRMQIKLNLKIFIFIIIFLLTRQIEIYGILMLFAFFHEMGHLFCGIIMGFKPKTLSISPVGLSISFQIKADEYNKKIIKGNKLALKKLYIALARTNSKFYYCNSVYILQKRNIWNLKGNCYIFKYVNRIV